MTECRNALGDASNLMDDPRTMRCITAKLPPPLVHQRHRQVDDIEGNRGRRVTFKDLVQFVSKEARVASNPVFGHQMYEGDQKNKSASTERNTVKNHLAMKPRAFMAVTEVEPEKSFCLFCSGKGKGTRLWNGDASAKHHRKKRRHSCRGCRSVKVS